MRTLVVMMALALCACDSAQEPSGKDRIYDTQRSVLEKAKQVNDTVQRAAEQQRADEEAQSK